MDDREALIQPTELKPLDGTERVGSATVFDFWRWALGDLRMNNARGYLAEFLVARALGDPSPVREEWASYDVKAADGTLVEVKATGRLQSWVTKRLSTPSWRFASVRASTVWSDELNAEIPIEPENRVHVWIFALHTAVESADYDPGDVTQWEFRVVPHRQLLASEQVSARLSFFDRMQIAPVPYSELRDAVTIARKRNDALGLNTASQRPAQSPGDCDDT
jgi:hypothetical protein